jgi:FecR protein
MRLLSPPWSAAIFRGCLTTLLLTTGFATPRCSAQADPNAVQDQARAVYVEGQVSRVSGEDLPWALSAGERVPVHQIITTGSDGVARFEVQGGTSFEIFSQSRVAFRQNAPSAGDLMDIEYGRVKVSLVFGPDRHSPVQRVMTPIVIITARANATFTILQREDQTSRIDVHTGEVFVQHVLLPRSESTPVKAGDAIIVERNEPISRKIDRGTIYRYAFRSIIDAMGTYLSRRLPDKYFSTRVEEGAVLEAQYSRLRPGR